MKRAFWMELRAFFVVFEGLSFGEKMKFDENSRHKL